MLTTMRKRVRVIMIIVAVTFVAGFLLGELWQIVRARGDKKTDVEAGIVGKVGDRKVTVDEFRNAVRYMTDKYKRDNQLRDLSVDDYIQIEDDAWKFLVGEITWGKMMTGAGVTISEQEIVEIMKANPPEDLRSNPELFDEQGNFSQEKYLQVMNNPQNQAYFSNYFQELAQMLPKEKLRLDIVNSTRVTSGEYEKLLRETSNSWNVTTLFFGPRVVTEKIDPTDDEALAYFKKHQDEFRTKEVRQLRYVKFPLVLSADDSVEAKEIIDRAHAQLQNGETFNLTIVDFSELVPDTTPVMFARERLDAPTDSVVSTLKPGQYSEPYETSYGWQVVMLDSVRGDSIALRRILARLKLGAENIGDVRERVRDFVDRARQVDFDSVAIDMGLQPQRAQPMVDGELNTMRLDLVSTTRLAEWAKKAKQGETMGEPVRGRSGFYVFHLTELKPEAVQDFEAVKKQAAWRVRQEREKEAWLAKAKEVLAEVRTGKSLEQCAGENPQLDMTREDYSSLQDARQRKGAEVAGALLALEPGETSSIIETNWGAFIIRCNSKTPSESRVEPAQFAQQQQQQVSQRLMQELLEERDVKDYRDPFSY